MSLDSAFHHQLFLLETLASMESNDSNSIMPQVPLSLRKGYRSANYVRLLAALRLGHQFQR